MVLKDDRDIAQLFLKMYIDCLNYRVSKKENKNIDCNKFYEQFVFYIDKSEKK